MFDAAAPPGDLDLLLSPGDVAEFVRTQPWRGVTGPEAPTRLHVALHRRHGLWTHAYRVVPDRRPGHQQVFLLRALAGDRRAELRAWLLALP